jgi:hypothetical protein
MGDGWWWELRGGHWTFQKGVTPPTHRGCSGEGEAHHTSHSWQGCLHCKPTVWTGRDGHER